MTPHLQDPAQITAAKGLPEPIQWRAVTAVYPFRLTEHLVGLIDPTLGEADPIYRQFMPDPAELAADSGELDPLAEESQMLAPRLIRRFRDRAVALVTARCAAHCRFCFRKRLWRADGEVADITDAELETMLTAIKATPEISEILVSGGDPLSLPNDRLKRVLEAFSALEQISAIRLATRMPMAAPQRFTPETLELLGSFDKLWVLTHFNHPRELTAESKECCRALIRRGIPVLNQTVLLKAVNDSPKTLEQLFRALVAIKVKPHYLFHLDPVQGARHFATGIDSGLAALRYFRSRLSSLAVPAFAIDLPEGGGKVSLQPDYSENGAYWDIYEQKLITYPDKERR